MHINTYDWITCLTIDNRYSAATTIIPLQIPNTPITFYLNGAGFTYPTEQYNKLWEDPPPNWPQSYGAWQHYICFKDTITIAKTKGYKNLLWLEDDLILLPGYNTIIDAATTELNRTPWDLLYYGANHTAAVTHNITPHIMRINGSLTTHMLGINNTIYDSILNLPPEHVIDKLIADYLHPRYNCYAIWPSIAHQAPGYSYITSSLTNYTDLFNCQGKNR